VMRGHVVLCGGIANYNATEPSPGPKNYLNLVAQRGRMEGFLVLDYLPRGRGDRRAHPVGAGRKRLRPKSTCRIASRTRQPRSGGCSRAATKASSCFLSPSSSPQQTGLASTPLSGEAAEASSRKLEPSLAVGFN
jgi:hypothetical protein